MIYYLNKGQEIITSKGVNHLRYGSEQIYQFDGLPGTGKSVVLNEIANRSAISKERIAPMAFTGAAAMVMRLKGFPNARTIHSWLYEPVLEPKMVNGKIVLDEYLQTPVLELNFIPKDISDIDAFFIDEGYMVPRHMRKEIEAKGKKIIVTGDSNQLKPVGDEPAYLYDKQNIDHLTEVMRQKKGSGILYIADRAIKGLPIQTGFYGDCLVIYQDELTNDMILGADIILCGRNETREKYNRMVREDLLRIHSDLPKYREKVICRQNNWLISEGGINLANGLSGYVSCPPDVTSFTGDTFKMDFKPDLFPYTFTNLEVNYNYFISDHKNREIIKKSRYGSIGEKFEFSYCITTHLSQGSQYANVIYIEEFMPDKNNLDFTAITRAKNFLIFCKRRRKYY
jgi:exodeoxyribonuclease-5